jgi:hypothetical protein
MKFIPKLPWIYSLRPLNIGLLAITAWIVSPGLLFSPFFAAMLMLMVLGNLHNDLRDYRADSLNRPDSNPFQSKTNRRLGVLLLLAGLALWLVFLSMVDSNFRVLGLIAVALALWGYNSWIQYFPIVGNAWLAGTMALCLFLFMHPGYTQLPIKIWACSSVAAVHFARELIKSLQDQPGDAKYKRLKYSLPPIWLYRLLASASLLGVAALSYYFWLSFKSPVILGLGFLLPLPWVLFQKNYKWLSAELKATMLWGLFSLYMCYFFA